MSSYRVHFIVIQVSQGSGAPPQDETSNEGLVVDVDSPATPQSEY